LAESAWATFTIFMTIPIAVVMGFYMFRWRTGRVREATVIGVTIMFLAVVFGKNVAESSMSHWFLLSKHQITIAMGLYTIAASVLPVWMLLTPRAYLSTFMKIGTIAFLVIGVMILNPKLQAPAFSQYVGGGGPVIPGPMFPFVFITIACGAISGFHALVSTGTTSKMVECETDMRPIGYGTTIVIVLGWAYFIWTGNINAIWPMFGVANQLLASVALAVGTTILINLGRAKYAWVTFVPLCWVATTTLTAGYMSVRDNFWPMAIGSDPALHVQGYVNTICTVIMMVCAVVILAATTRRSLQVLTGRIPAIDLADVAEA